MFYEEMGELMQAVNKHMRMPGPNTLVNLEEEIADVCIMLTQVELIIGTNATRIDENIDWKLGRLEKRMARD